MAANTWTSLLLLSSDTPPNLLLLSLGLAIFVLLSYYYFVKGSAGRHGGRLLPPGSLGLPLGLGENLHFILGNNGPLGLPRPFLSSRFRKYGPIFKTHLLGFPTVISMDPDFNKLLLSNEGKLVQAAFPNFLKRFLGPGSDLHGESHQQRRELLKSIFGSNVVQSYHFIPLQEYTCKFLDSWSDKAVLDAHQQSQKFAFMYVMQFLLNLTPEDPDALMLLHDYHIFLRFQASVPMDLPGTTFNKVVKAHKRISDKIHELVSARRKMTELQVKDLMAVLNNYDDTLTNQEIVDIIIPLIIAAIDATSTLFTTVLKFLSENPKAIDELREEHALIRANKKENEFLTWDDFRQMQFTKCVIKEALRITNIAEFVPREALQDIIFRDMVIPKGWRLLINFSMIHLNSSNFENPTTFDPWRWKDNNRANNPTLFTPFGGGTRMCLGPLLAEVEVSIFLHYLVTRYKWEMLPDTGGQRNTVSGFLLSKMQKGVLMKITPI